MHYIFVLLLMFLSQAVHATEKPFQPACVLDAKILSVDQGRSRYNTGVYYNYFELGVLKKSVNLLQSKTDLKACSSVLIQDTDVLRYWDWNNKGRMFYADGTVVNRQDDVRLTLAPVYVGDTMWPSIINIERLVQSTPEQSSSADLDCQEGMFVPLRYVYFNPQSHENEAAYFQGSKPVTPEQIKRMEYVLNTYRVAFKTVDSKIQISCAVWKDQDLMANYTVKANDEEWLKEHSYE